VNERDRLIGDLNYLKKKLQSLINDNEKLQRSLSKHGLEVSQGGDSFDKANTDPIFDNSYHSSSSAEGKVRRPHQTASYSSTEALNTEESKVKKQFIDKKPT
jgi:hypothetical protein